MRVSAAPAERPAPSRNAAATSSWLYLRWTRLSDGGCASVHTPGRHCFAGRIGRGAKPPPQFGQTFCSLLSTQSAQNVHS